MTKVRERVERCYDWLVEDGNGRVCAAISDEACREVPHNFFAQLISNTLTKVGDRLANPKTTLAWLLQALAAPAIFTGLIVPLRESGSLLPQIVIAGFVRRLPVRKWVWVVGSGLQAMAVAGMALVALNLFGVAAGWGIVGCLVIFSLARGLCSVASKDVLGKTIPKTRRGRLTGWMSSASGLVAVGVGGLLLLSGKPESDASVELYAGLLLVAAGLWILAALIFAGLREFAGETDGTDHAFKEAFEQMRVLRTDRAFRRFVLVRTLAIGSGLGTPFVIALAYQQLGGSVLWLGVFIIADGLAALVAAPLLGQWADRSSRSLLRVAMAGSGVLLLMVAGLSLGSLSASVLQVLFPLIFFLMGVMHSGVRLGRKTYLVDMAEGNQRTTYVAVSNTLIGVMLLASGVVTGLVSLISIPGVLGLFAGAAGIGAFLGRGLPEVGTDTNSRK